MKVDRWILNFKSLTVENQLKVIKAINEEFGSYTFDIENKTFNIIDFFEIFVNGLDDLEKLKELKDILKRFERLPDERKVKVIEGFAKSIIRHEQLEEQYQKEETCKREGHLFTEWNYHEWTTYEDTWYDHQLIENFPIHHQEWTRKCTRCGCCEKETGEPVEVREKRIKKEKEEKIKNLELELKLLKGE
jgi:hypothetical protein